MSQQAQIAAIRQTIDEYQRHQNDPDEFLRLHTTEAAVVNVAGHRVLGKDRLSEAMTAALAGSLAKVTTRLELEDIRFIRPDVAIASLAKHVNDERNPDSRGTLPTVGSLTLVLANDDGRWRVALAQTTPRQTF